MYSSHVHMYNSCVDVIKWDTTHVIIKCKRSESDKIEIELSLENML